MSTSETHYTGVAIALHWLIAGLIFVAFPLGLYMSDLPLSPTRLKLYSYHKWIGITVLALAIVRLGWRSLHRPPPLPITMPRWQQITTHAMHHLLYMLLFIVPLSGWMMSSAKGFQTVWFGVLPLPNLVDKDKALGELLTDVHEGLNWTLFVLVGIHIAAALKHHFIDRDDLMSRMSLLKKTV
jgi:cytochrome b561